MPWVWLTIVSVSCIASFTWLVMNGHPCAAAVPAIVLFASGLKSTKDDDDAA